MATQATFDKWFAERLIVYVVVVKSPNPNSQVIVSVCLRFSVDFTGHRDTKIENRERKSE